MKRWPGADKLVRKISAAMKLMPWLTRGRFLPSYQKNVMTQLGVLSVGNRLAEYADGRKDSVELTEPITFIIIGRIAVEPAIVLGDEVIIGQTILEVLDLQVDFRNQKLIPSPAHPD